MFDNAFPKELNKDLQEVLKILPKTTFNNVNRCCSENCIEYKVNNCYVNIPYRVYLSEPEDENIDKLNELQKCILFCIYTRSCNGYIREKYVRKILNHKFESWCIPYIVKLSDEYIIEILEVIYECLIGRCNEDFQEFCRENKEATRKSYARMTSYWNEYYRNREHNFHQYIGRRLFRDCFGYNRSYGKF